MRLAAYAGASTALAAGVVVYAFNQRANFYSACVYLAQSNLCLMILTNLILFIIATFMFGLQRIFYGPLRPIEIEQLYEKAWFAVTETCLAMTIFREEVGAWFLVMFVALLTGKVWGWIGEGRVEVLDQQPPTNPRLFHARLSVSLTLSVVYDMWLLAYTVNTVIQQARPNMMVMFLFEFAILTTSSYSTTLRYIISLVDARITKRQTQERLEQRRREVRAEREEMIRERAAATITSEETAALPDLPSEDDVDEMDIEVPGWENKGQWILTLDLLTDLFKLGIYMSFFFILLTFYGLPIHIMRDLFLTARSFVTRLTAFLRYRRATRDMNQRYPDATVEEIQREDTCIICREEMIPWSVTNAPDPAIDPNGPGQPPVAQPRTARVINERTRPKKLPCGHVLHLGCLKSWLERQQVCPTCRRPVVDNSAVPVAARPGQAAAGQAPGQPQLPGAVPPNQGAGPGLQPNAPRMRMINFGPIRLAFGQAALPLGNGQPFGVAPPVQQNGAPAVRVNGLQFGFPRVQPPQADTAAHATSANSIHEQLHAIEQQIMDEIRDLQVTHQELQIVQLLQAELFRLRTMQGAAPIQPGGSAPNMHQIPLPNLMSMSATQAPEPRMERHEAPPGVAAIPSGHPDLPPGITIPEGWTLLPLERVGRPPPSINHDLESASSAAVSAQPAGVQTPTSTSLARTAVTDEPSSSASQSEWTTIDIPEDGQNDGSSHFEPHDSGPLASATTSPLHLSTPTGLSSSSIPPVVSSSPFSTTQIVPNPIETTRGDAPGTSSNRPDTTQSPYPTTSNASTSAPSSQSPPNPAATWSWGGQQPVKDEDEEESPSPINSIGVPPISSGTDNGLAAASSNVIHSTTDGSGEYRRDKGKAKATSVEDVADEDDTILR